MNEKGIYLTIEALLSLILLVAILSVFAAKESPPIKPLNDLYLVQKGNDLVKVWIMEKNFEEEEMKADFLNAFNGLSGIIDLNGKKTEIFGKKGKERIVIKGFFIGKENELSYLTLTVFY